MAPPNQAAEVSAAIPAVRTIDAADYLTLIARPEWSPVLSPESSGRRSFYLNQEQRSLAESGFSGDYETFLKSCEMRMTITRAGPDNIDRVHELIQGTNQMNFSGNRYARNQIDELAADPLLDQFVLHCEDRFGNYGIVGFCMVDKAEPNDLGEVVSSGDPIEIAEALERLAGNVQHRPFLPPPPELYSESHTVAGFAHLMDQVLRRRSARQEEVRRPDTATRPTR